MLVCSANFTKVRREDSPKFGGHPGNEHRLCCNSPHNILNIPLQRLGKSKPSGGATPLI